MDVLSSISSSTRITIIAVFSIYTLLLLGYGIFSRRQMKNGKGDYLSKYYTGGRTGGVLMTAMMVSAGVAGAGVFMGVPGFTYTYGAVWMVCCFWSMTSNFMVLGLIGKRIGIVARRINAQTFIDLFKHRYNNSKAFVVLSSLVILFFLGAFAVSTITGGGRIFQLLTGEDYRIGLAIFTVLVIIAAITGGIKGVATAIIIQGIVMTISVLILFVMGVRSTGLSYTGTIQSLVQTNPEWFKPVWKPQMVFSFAVLWGFTTFTMPHVTMTALTYKDTKTLNSSIKIGTIVFAIWMLGLNGLCFIVKYKFPQGSLPTADLGIPALAVTTMPAWAAGLVLAGVCGAVQSSVGGMIVSLAGTIVKDLYKNLINPKADEKNLKLFNTIITVVIALIIFAFACNPPKLLAQLITYATGGMTVAFFHTILLGLYWKRANEYGACAGILSGIVLYLLIDAKILPISLGMNACVMATAISTVIMVVVCLLTPKSPYRIVATWFGKDFPELN